MSSTTAEFNWPLLTLPDHAERTLMLKVAALVPHHPVRTGKAKAPEAGSSSAAAGGSSSKPSQAQAPAPQQQQQQQQAAKKPAKKRK
jgi:hypothetical protein